MTPDYAIRNQIVMYARRCKGTPWVSQGRQPGLGLDCIGLAIEAAKGAGEWSDAWAVQVPANYGPIPHKNRFLRFMQKNLVQVSREEALVGDLLLLCFKSYPMHVGIIADQQRDGCIFGPFSVIHAMANMGYTHEQTWGPSFIVQGVYRFPGLAAREGR